MPRARRSRGLLHPSQVRRTTNATQARAQALSYIYLDDSRLFVVAHVRHMLHRVPQLPLPSADARYASLTGTTILAPFPLVCAATIDAFAPHMLQIQEISGKSGGQLTRRHLRLFTQFVDKYGSRDRDATERVRPMPGARR